jgi:hypothetical protein
MPGQDWHFPIKGGGIRDRQENATIEKKYEDEDTRMMKRLIDVRKALWT